MTHLVPLYVLVISMLFVATPYAAEDIPQNEEPSKVEEFSLLWPLNCTLSKDCFIDAYPDLKTGTDHISPVDYQCGSRTKPNIKGTSILFVDYKTALKEQPVLAAANGRVIFVKNNLKDDRRYSNYSKKACGNHIIIRHDNAYSTKYCHLRKGSATVKAGQRVVAGDSIGIVGSSGSTSTPKFYFELLKNNQAIDPFSSRVLAESSECFSTSDKSLWKESIPYLKAGIISASFMHGKPSIFDLHYDSSVVEKLSDITADFSAWVRVFGINKNDKETITIFMPNGKIWHESSRAHPMNTTTWLSIASASPKDNLRLKKGTWKAVYKLKRDGEYIIEHPFFIEIE